MNPVDVKKLDFLPLPCCYVGPAIDQGPLPAFIYFSLSAEESLGLHPYNQPVKYLSCRSFSFTLPGHEEGRNKFHALEYWATEMSKGHDVIREFIDHALQGLERLIKEGVIDPNKMATGGLSRGAFLATHLASQEKRISYLLGYAPLTHLSHLKEFKEMKVDPELNLISLASSLMHLRGLRFYISNHDTRVGTDPCYQFIKKVSEEVHEKRVRNCHVELRITSPIGHQGHGTTPEIFEEGALWIEKELL